MDKGKNIPEYSLFIHPMAIAELKRDIWVDEPIAAKLTVHKRKYEIDLAYRGSHIRDFKKKSYFLSFHKPPLFRQAKEVHLNAEYMDPSFIRNKLSLDFFQDIGCLSPTSRFVTLKLNGRNEGLYLELESVDEHFLAKRDLPKGAIFYAVDGDANFSLMSDLDEDVKESLDFGYELKYGTPQDAYHLQDMIIRINTVPRPDFEQEIVKLIDVDRYLRWLAGVVLTQNYDGFVHNYALYRNGDTGLFEMLPWDYDATWGRDIHGEEMEADYLRIEGFNTLSARVLDVKGFRMQYKRLLEELLEHQFTVAYMKPKIDELHQAIRPYVQKDPYEKDNLDAFDQEPAFICKFIEERAAYVRSQLGRLDS